MRSARNSDHQQAGQQLNGCDVMIAKRVSVAGKYFQNAKHAIQVRHRRGQNGLRSQLSAAIAINMGIRFGGVAAPTDTRTCAQSRDSVAKPEFYSQIGSNISGLRLTHQLALA